jgi:DNA mismatch repair protein MutH
VSAAYLVIAFALAFLAGVIVADTKDTRRLQREWDELYDPAVRLRVAMRKLTATIGEALVPAAQALTEGIRSFAEAFDAVPDDARGHA